MTAPATFVVVLQSMGVSPVISGAALPQHQALARVAPPRSRGAQPAAPFGDRARAARGGTPGGPPGAAGAAAGRGGRAGRARRRLQQQRAVVVGLRLRGDRMELQQLLQELPAAPVVVADPSVQLAAQQMTPIMRARASTPGVAGSVAAWSAFALLAHTTQLSQRRQQLVAVIQRQLCRLTLAGSGACLAQAVARAVARGELSLLTAQAFMCQVKRLLLDVAVVFDFDVFVQKQQLPKPPPPPSCSVVDQDTLQLSLWRITASSAADALLPSSSCSSCSSCSSSSSSSSPACSGSAFPAAQRSRRRRVRCLRQLLLGAATGAAVLAGLAAASQLRRPTATASRHDSNTAASSGRSAAAAPQPAQMPANSHEEEQQQQPLACATAVLAGCSDADDGSVSAADSTTSDSSDCDSDGGGSSSDGSSDGSGSSSDGSSDGSGSSAAGSSSSAAGSSSSAAGSGGSGSSAAGSGSPRHQGRRGTRGWLQSKLFGACRAAGATVGKVSGGLIALAAQAPPHARGGGARRSPAA